VSAGEPALLHHDPAVRPLSDWFNVGQFVTLHDREAARMCAYGLVVPRGELDELGAADARIRR
jgi:hypothetical protein